MKPRNLVAALCLAALFLPAAVSAAPLVMFTDITAGPNVGGENNNGAYLTIFGNGFGASQGTSTVTINGKAVAAVKVWNNTQISVQPGSGVTSGPIVVTVGGVASNASQSFTVQSGNIYFVATTGSDSTGKVNDITHPYASPQTVWNVASPGDQIVVMGGTYTKNSSNGCHASFFCFYDKSYAVNGYDVFVLMGYPGQVATINSGGALVEGYGMAGGFTVSNFTSIGGCAGVTTGANGGSPVEYLRYVNLNISGMPSDSGGTGCISGRGLHIKVLGSVVHDSATNDTGLDHSIYFDNADNLGTSDVEIAYNLVYNQYGGRGIQIYDANLGIASVSVHHNIIHDIALDGILFGNGTTTGLLAYNNLVYNTASTALQTGKGGGSCLRFNSPNLVGAGVYNNTFYNCAIDGSSSSAGIRYEGGTATLVNNLVDTSGGTGYIEGTAPASGSSSNNLWYGSGAAPAWDTAAVSANPSLVSTTGNNFRLSAGSPAIDKGTAAGAVITLVTFDLDGNVRPQGVGYDIGAYEYTGVTLPAPTNVTIKLK